MEPCRAVGWNWTNSTSATGTPARSAMARPSPVDCGGLVVTENTCPAPPVASRVWAARSSTSSPVAVDGGDAPAPAALDDQVQGEPPFPQLGRRLRGPPPRGPAPLRRRWRPRRRGRHGRPNAHPRGPAPTCPGRCDRRPAPRAASSRTRAGPSVTRTSTAARSHRPAPATRVSSACSASGSPGGRLTSASVWCRTAATPPWAHWVAESARAPFDSTPTRRPGSSSAAGPRPTGRRRRCRRPAGRRRSRHEGRAAGRSAAGGCGNRRPVPLVDVNHHRRVGAQLGGRRSRRR